MPAGYRSTAEWAWQEWQPEQQHRRLHWNELAECAKIRVVGKKAKQSSESLADREMAIEAAHFARKFGLTKEEALKMLKDARNLQSLANLTDRPKGH